MLKSPRLSESESLREHVEVLIAGNPYLSSLRIKDLEALDVGITEDKAFMSPMVSACKNILMGGTRIYSCGICHQAYTSKQGLHQHIGKLHMDDEKTIPCPECGKKFKHKHAVLFHLKQVHLKSTRVGCDVCGNSFYNKYELSKHVRRHHPNVTES